MSKLRDTAREARGRKLRDTNEYGDPKDTVYAGGTPLFDEATGEEQNKAEYLLRKHFKWADKKK